MLKKFGNSGIIEKGKPSLGIFRRKGEEKMKKRFVLNVFVTLCLILIVATNFIFLKEVAHYGWLSFGIVHIESCGNREIYTKDGVKKGWDVYPDLVSSYNKRIAQKSELVKSSDVAEWIAVSAETITGQVVRFFIGVISIVLFLVATYVLIKVLLEDMGCLIDLLRID